MIYLNFTITIMCVIFFLHKLTSKVQDICEIDIRFTHQIVSE